MGVNTKGFIYGENREQFTKEALVQYLSERYEGVQVLSDDNSYGWEYIRIHFLDGGDIRNLSIHYNYTSFKHEGYPEIEDDAIVLFDLNRWGNSVEIIKGIVSYFGGGYCIDDDCSDDWYIVSSDSSSVPEITLHNKVMVKYQLSEKGATEWIKHYTLIKGII